MKKDFDLNNLFFWDTAHRCFFAEKIMYSEHTLHKIYQVNKIFLIPKPIIYNICMT